MAGFLILEAMNGRGNHFVNAAPEPPSADFAFESEFRRGEGSASRVFLAINDFINGCERLDTELANAIDVHIETVMALEDIEAGSIKVWLRNVLNLVDDEVLKKLDWKPAVGKYLVKATYAIIRWTNDDSAARNLSVLGQEIRTIAVETDVKHLPDYRAPSPAALLNAVRDFQKVKERLMPGDRAVYIPAEGEPIEMNLSIRLNIDDIEAMAVRETMTFPIAPMILAVKKPDYLGDSKWELRHGKRTIAAKIEDTTWLKRFQAREIDVRPGDALKCEVRIENLYGHDNELLTERYTIVHVVDVLADSYRQPSLFSDNHADLPPTL